MMLPPVGGRVGGRPFGGRALEKSSHWFRVALARVSTFGAQVKTQFGNLPHIYNQFLEIMKNFKAQAYVAVG